MPLSSNSSFKMGFWLALWLVHEIKWYGQNIEGHCFCWGLWLILYLIYTKSNYVELCAHCSFMLIPKSENSPLLALPFIDNMLLLFVILWLLAVQFLWHYRCATFTVTKALLCPLHCGLWKWNLPGWPMRLFEQICDLIIGCSSYSRVGLFKWLLWFPFQVQTSKYMFYGN